MHRIAVTLALATLAGPAVLTAPVQAAPVYTGAFVGSESFSGTYGDAGCLVGGTASGDTTELPVVDNGATSTRTTAIVGSTTHSGDPDAAFATSFTGRAKVTSAGGNPRTLSMSGTGTVSFDAAAATSTCVTQGGSSVRLRTELVTSDPGFFTVTWDASKYAFYDVSVEDSEAVTLDSEGWGRKHRGTVTTFLAPGTHYVNLDTGSQVFGNTDVPSTAVDVAVLGTFVVAGSQTAALQGKAKPYLKVPKARTCSGDRIAVEVTGKKSKAATIKKVVVKVNGKKAGRVSSPGPGARIRAKAPQDADAVLVATVTLKGRPGRPGRTITAATSYVACT